MSTCMAYNCTNKGTMSIIGTANNMDGKYCPDHIDLVERFLPDEDGVHRGKVRCYAFKCPNEGTVQMPKTETHLKGLYCEKHANQTDV